MYSVLCGYVWHVAGAPKAEGAATWRSLRDDARVVIALAPAPRGALLAAADSLGRVMLVDAANMRLVRMWKVRPTVLFLQTPPHALCCLE